MKNIPSCIRLKIERKIGDWLLKFKRNISVPMKDAIESMDLMFHLICI